MSNLRLENYDYTDEVEDFIRRVISSYDPALVLVFGSLIRGDYWHDSDADIIVILKEKRINHLTAGMEMRKLGYNMPLDLFVYGTEQFIDMVNSGNLLALDAMEYGKIIYTGDDNFLQKLQSIWTNKRKCWEPTDFGWIGK